MADKEMTFEAAMARLEEIVRALEGGSAGLDAESRSSNSAMQSWRARSRRSSCLPPAATARLSKRILTGAVSDAELA